MAFYLLVKAGVGVLTNPEQLLFTMTGREIADDLDPPVCHFALQMTNYASAL